MSLTLKQKIRKQLFEGKYPEAEAVFYEAKKEKADREWQGILTEVGMSKEAHRLAKKLKEQNGYGSMRKQQVGITTMSGGHISIPTWYAIKKGKKKGKAKKGPNGRGDNLLLRYWGFIGRQSPNYTSRISRHGVACQSYELAAEELKESGIDISGPSVDHATQKVGDIAHEHRTTIALDEGESCKGKRVMIALDGGRIRMREKKSGRYEKTQKRARFNAQWREPKLLVIAELDENGKQKKGTKSIYEATMKDHNELFYLLHALAKQTNIQEAKEVVLSGDGARWIWEKYEWLIRELGIERKATQVLDFYHASEHLNEIAEANTGLNSREKRQWFKQLKDLLHTGKFFELKESIEKESQEKKIPDLLKLFQYFENNKERIRYDQYEKHNQPIGSGIVESAIRRVINLKLKSPSTFWNIQNVEKMLQLRCILMAGRWKILFKNILKVRQFQLV